MRYVHIGALLEKCQVIITAIILLLFSPFCSSLNLSLFIAAHVEQMVQFLLKVFKAYLCAPKGNFFRNRLHSFGDLPSYFVARAILKVT